MDEERRDSANNSNEPNGQSRGIPHPTSGQQAQPGQQAESDGQRAQTGRQQAQSYGQQSHAGGQYESQRQFEQRRQNESGMQYQSAGQSAQSGAQYQTGQQQAGQYPARQYRPNQYPNQMPQYYGNSSQETSKQKPAKKGPGWGALVVAMILTAALTVLGTVGILKYSDVIGPQYQPPQSQDTPQPEGDKTNVIETEGNATDWEKVAEAVRPATVTIQVAVGDSGDTGSGVVWDADGHIVTNYHVVSSAAGSGDSQITVTMSGGRLFEAQIVGLDSTTDLAVIKLVNPPSDLVAANFGDSSELIVGQNVMAIGSPLGLSDTVTTGIISALDRPVAVKTAVPKEQEENYNYQFPFFQREQAQSETVITNAIQVDASINPGNSGGPLFDQSGYVVGINSSIASMGSEQGNSGSIGLGFAIPVNLVKNVATQLIETGEAQHAQLGVTISSAAVTVDGVTRLGAEVVSILPGGAAAGADIKEGDVIISIDSNDVVSSRALTGYVRRYNTGDTVTIGIARGGTLHEVQVVLQAQ